MIISCLTYSQKHQQEKSSVKEIVGIYQSNTEIIEGVHIYLMLNNKMVFVTAQGINPDVLSNPKNWMKHGTYKFDGKYIKFDYGKTFTYTGNGSIDAAGIFIFQLIRSF